jgi:hypothetical protein
MISCFQDNSKKSQILTGKDLQNAGSIRVGVSRARWTGLKKKRDFSGYTTKPLEEISEDFMTKLPVKANIQYVLIDDDFAIQINTNLGTNTVDLVPDLLI